MIFDAKTNDFVKKFTSSRAWIGGHRVGPRPGSNGQWTWIDGSPLVYSKWSPGQPDNYGGGIEFCLEMNFGANGDWNDSPCDTRSIQHFICHFGQI